MAHAAGLARKDALPRGFAVARSLALAFALCLLATELAGAAPAARTATTTEFPPIDAHLAARRFADAESLATRLAARLDAERPLDSLALAGALARYAEARGEQGRRRNDPGIAAALRAAQILELLHTPGFTAVRMRVIAGIMLFDTSQRDSALAVMQSAVERADRGGAAPDSALAHWQLTLGRVRLGVQGTKFGMPHLHRALELSERRFGPDHPAVATVLDYLGSLYATLAEYDSSRIALERARTILEAQAETQPRALGSVLNSLATLERMQGNMGESVDLLQRALEITRTVDGDSSLGVARLRAALALRLALMNDHRGAVRQLELALPTLEARLGPEALPTLNNRVLLANTRLALGDTVTALADLEAAHRLMAPHPERHHRNLAYHHHVLAQILEARGHRADAVRLLAESLSLMGPLDDPRGTARGETLGKLFDHVDSPAERATCDSLARMLEQLAGATPLRESSVWLGVRTAKARAEVRCGNEAAAWEDGIATEREARKRMVADARTLSEARALELSNVRGEPLDVLVELARTAPGPHASVAWDRVVRWRGLVREEIARLRAPRAGDEAERTAHAAWVAAQRRYARRVVNGGGSSDDAEALDAARRDAEEAERRWLREAGAEALRAPDSVGLGDVVRTLGAGEALVSFFETHLARGRERLVAFVARGDESGVRTLDLGPSAPIRDAVARWRESLGESPALAAAGRATAEARCRRLGGDVRRRVWDPLAAALGTARTIDVVGDGPVTDLPWQALPEGGGFLVESSVALHPLESERERLRPRPAATHDALLAVGDPDFGRPALSRPSASGPTPAARGMLPECVRTEGVRLEALPSARAEAIDVAERWRLAGGASTEQLLVGAEATEAAFKREAPRATVIHLATHGIVIQDTCTTDAPGTRGVGAVQPLARKSRRSKAPVAGPPAPASAPVVPWAGRRVWLAFAGAGRPPAEAIDENEGWLTAEEVATLDLRGVEWVVLSACHSGLAQSWTRDGSLGMRRAFELAGARSVIASQWAVEDAATREWMRALHGARAAGVRHAGEAVREADHVVLKARRASARSTHPFYWAAFAATGE